MVVDAFSAACASSGVLLCPKGTKSNGGKIALLTRKLKRKRAKYAMAENTRRAYLGLFNYRFS